MSKKNTPKIVHYFLQGLLVLGPVAITIYSIYFVFESIDRILRPVIDIPGLGFIIILVSITLIGYLSSFFLLERLISLVDKILEKTPGIKLVYSFVRDFFEAFAGNNKKFTHHVLANVDYQDVWRVGFITQEDMAGFGMRDYVAVYVPMSYSVAGNIYVIPKDRVKPIPDISATEAMKFAVSGGVTQSAEPESILQNDNADVSK